MEKFNIGYKRLGREEGQIYSIISKDFLLLNILAFLLGRASILNGLNPFGVAYFTTLMTKDKKNSILGLSILLGILTTNADKYRYMLILGLNFIVFRYIVKNIRFNTSKLAFLTGSITFFSGVLYLFLTEFYLYDLFMTSFESIIVFVFIYILSYSIPILTVKSNRKILSNEEVICIAIILAVSVLGLSDVIFFGYDLKNIVGIFIILVFAYNGGAAIGAAVGVTIGIITSMSTVDTPVIIGIYGFSGLLAGIFKDVGKVTSALGIVLSNSILTFYINGSTETLVQFEEIVIAFLIFILLPKSVSEYINKFISLKSDGFEIDKVYSERIKKLMLRQLENYSLAFSELAVTYSKIAEKEKVVEQKEITNIINNIANSICLNCNMKRSCWNNCFYSTYNALVDSITLVEAKGILDKNNVPDYLRKRCLRLEKLINIINSAYEIYKIDYKWNKKLFEMRQLVSEQFNGISQILRELSKEISSNIEFKRDVEDALYVAFDKEGIIIDKITVLENENGRFEIDIEKKKCFDREICERRIIPIVKKVIGREVVHKNRNCNKGNENGSCLIQLVEAQKYKVNTGVAKVSKDNYYISGDNYSFMDLDDNKYMLALSDGMGTGEKAAKESVATITLLEQLLGAGFNKNIAIKTINSVLMSKSLDEAFSTIDLSIVDLYSGKVEFIKIGAVPSFIKRTNGNVEVIHASSLPVGIVNEIAIDSKSVKLNSGDFIITMSDGVLDVDKNFIDKTNWMVELIKDINSRNPQVIADSILDKAIERNNNKIEDDMTVLVTKIWKRR
ncbi:stage II sporulation protein E [Caminicella sporogenes]|nr:stage II sporulation protein E [Caminicella sporogenes]WIF95664.1 stage II sporulation protein E [Caminicella sporogenes]